MSLNFENTDTLQSDYNVVTASWVDGSKCINPLTPLPTWPDKSKYINSLTPLSTPTEPTITLKRGRVEISIKNAAAIVQKMEELFPKNEHYGSGHSWTRSQKKLYDHDKSRAWVVAAKNWFKQEFYGTNDEDFDIIVSSEQQSPSQQNVNLPEKQASSFEEDRKSVVSIPCPPQVEKSVNKNAYEIRTDVLGMALDWVKYKTPDIIVSKTTDDDVLNTAQKFYRFVENRR